MFIWSFHRASYIISKKLPCFREVQNSYKQKRIIKLITRQQVAPEKRGFDLYTVLNFIS